MSAQGLEVIDHTVQVTHEWINDLAERLQWRDRKQVLHLLRSTLGAVRDMLSHDEAAHLAAQLPLVLRGLFYEGWRPSTTPRKERHAADFISQVEAELRNDGEYRGPADIEEVFRLLNSRVTPGEVRDVRSALPKELRRLWPEPA